MAEKEFREKHFTLIWKLLWPVRAYVKGFPFQRGKGILLRLFIVPFLPSRDRKYVLPLPGSVEVLVGYRDTIGLSSLLYGVFEHEEMSFAFRYVKKGDVCFDVGANIGIFSVVMGKGVGLEGAVIAVDPIIDNIERIRENAKRNGLKSIRTFQCAVGDKKGELVMRVPEDTVFASACDSKYLEGVSCTEIRVPLRTIDDIWEECGRPRVSFLKLDIEGGEIKALGGARKMILESYPTILSEANTQADLALLDSFLSPLGYRRCKPEGFLLHNYVFVRPAHDLFGE